jgi:hypothetical protein
MVHRVGADAIVGNAPYGLIGSLPRTGTILGRCNLLQQSISLVGWRALGHLQGNGKVSRCQMVIDLLLQICPDHGGR